MGEIEKRMEEKGIELPPAPKPMGAYVPAVRTGNLIFVSGQLPRMGDDFKYQGRVDEEISAEDGKKAARLAALNAVSVLKELLGDLDKVKRIVKLKGSVYSSSGFNGQPEVINGASDLMVEIFGDKGLHARMAQGLFEIPARASVAVELIVEVGDD
jgi:enamine deaminase RidA (YjgF/YER057c/UK114 family)